MQYQPPDFTVQTTQPKPHIHLPWCAPQNQEAITQAILQNTRTQFQFSPDQPADGSDECAEDKSAEGFR